MTNNDELAMKLKAAAEKVTVLDLDTSQIERGNDGYYECPVCCGLGEVEAETDFCNIDGVALGVQFYGIGEHHGAAEEYFRTVAPANILALLAERDADKKRIAELTHNHRVHAARLIDERGQLKERIAELEARTEIVKLPKPHAHLIWIQAGRGPDDYWDDVAVSHSLKDRCCDGSERYPVYSIFEIQDACAAAGIKLEVGE